MKHHPIYEEMIERNTLLIERDGLVFDNMLGRPNDYRRCIALVADGQWEFSDKYHDSMCALVDGIDPRCYELPTCHHTFLVARPIEYIERGEDYRISRDDLKLLEASVKKYVRPYNVVFDKIIAVKTGVLLAGGDDILDKVNQMREQFRVTDLIYGERYNMDILHFTAFRWKLNGERLDSLELLKRIKKLWGQENMGDYYAKLKVTKIHIKEASWLLRAQECKTLATIHLGDCN